MGRQHLGLVSLVVFWADQRLAAGPGRPPQPQEQLQWPRPPAPHHRQPGAGHLQPHGAPAPHGDAEEAGEEGKGFPGLLILPLTHHPEGSDWEVTLCPCFFGFAPQVRGKSPASRATNECRDSWPPKSSKCLADPALPLPESLLRFPGVESPWESESAPSSFTCTGSCLDQSSLHREGGTHLWLFLCRAPSQWESGPLGQCCSTTNRGDPWERDVIPAFLLLCTI